MNRAELEKIYKKHIHGYLERDRIARFEDIPTRIFIDAMEEALSIPRISGMFSEEQMEQAWTDGCGCGETRSGFFDIENYR